MCPSCSGRGTADDSGSGDAHRGARGVPTRRRSRPDAVGRSAGSAGRRKRFEFDGHGTLAAGVSIPLDLGQERRPLPWNEPAADPLGHNLPSPRTRFMGRERELAQVETLLATPALVTLTGAGGCGKTRLAL